MVELSGTESIHDWSAAATSTEQSRANVDGTVFTDPVGFAGAATVTAAGGWSMPTVGAPECAAGGAVGGGHCSDVTGGSSAALDLPDEHPALVAAIATATRRSANERSRTAAIIVGHTAVEPPPSRP